MCLCSEAFSPKKKRRNALAKPDESKSAANEDLPAHVSYTLHVCNLQDRKRPSPQSKPYKAAEAKIYRMMTPKKRSGKMEIADD